ncbi:MAG: hypothetical protein QNJ00_16015, partial [Woeseiaceae bacterium]|nr:hypothetical protein [Woeseiaceae bacterium]
KGSTFPLVNGGVGVLYEAGAALGREIETDSGLRTYRENIRKHFRTAIAGIEAGALLRLDLLRYQQDFYGGALDAAARHPVKAWVFQAPGDPARLDLFVDLLNFHRIDVYRLARDVTVDGTAFSANEALVVPAAQTQHRLIRSIFETVSEFEDATFYDVSTWTLPPAFGLEYAALGGREFRASVLGAQHERPASAAATSPDEATYAYAFEWTGYYAPRALQRILETGALARVATKPFSVSTASGVVKLGRGSIVVPFDRQAVDRTDIHTLMATIAEQDGVTVHSMSSGSSAIGSRGVEVGGPSFKSLAAPRTLLVVGRDVNLYDAGEVWHLLDYRMNMPVTLRSRDRLDGIDWSRYTHVIFPGGDYDEYEPEFANRMRQWVAEGGTLIGMRDAAPWVRAMTLDYIDPLSEEGMALAAAPAEEEEEPEPFERLAYGEKDSREAVDIIGGAIFTADLDVSHPLGFGYADRRIHLHKNVEEPFENTRNPYATVIAYADDPVLSGYVSANNRDALAGTPALIAERSGAGSVILFADNPNFRGYWYGTNKLFLNALFFSRAFDAPDED